jgi:hypothetical protein
VADFTDMSGCGLDNPTAVNLADAFIFRGVFGLIAGSNRSSRPVSRAPRR